MGKTTNTFDANCARPACDDMMDKMKAAAAAVSTKKKPPTECPVYSAQLGRSSWTLLHTMAAWFPDQPTEQDQSDMKSFFQTLARFYPCTYCAEDFQQSLQNNPTKTSSRQELCRWLCEQHNTVNRKLGKPIFPCDIKSLDERWRDNPNCRGNGDE